jgi:hypothetical protein
MRIFSFYPDGENALTLVEAEDEYFEDHFVGERMADGWNPPRVNILGKSKPVRDFVSWSLSAMVVSPRARNALQPLIANHVEFLPLTTVNGEMLFAVNVIEVLECLDRSASEASFSPDDPKRIIHINRFVFLPERIRNVPLFKVPEWPGAIFVSEEFAEIVVHAGLSGAGFEDPDDIRYLKSQWDRTMAGLPRTRDYDVEA